VMRGQRNGSGYGQNYSHENLRFQTGVHNIPPRRGGIDGGLYVLCAFVDSV
jgi:hypothetical protein